MHLPEVQQNKENYGKGGGRKRKEKRQRSDCIQKYKRTMVSLLQPGSDTVKRNKTNLEAGTVLK